MATDNKAKILRIGIIQDRRVVEERLLRKHADVSIGQGPKNTFIVPTSRLPHSRTLFEAKQDGSYAIVFERGMEGRVDLGKVAKKPLTFRELSKSKHVHRRGKSYVVNLTNEARGKAVFGDVTLLFQFVEPPPMAPRPQLPAAARGGLASQLEWPLVYILVLAFLVLGGLGSGLDVYWRMTGQYLEVQYDKRNNRAYELLKAQVREKEEQPPEKKVDEEKKEDANKEPEKEVEEPKPEPPPPEPPKREVKRIKKVKPTAKKRETNRKKLTAKVRNKTFLKALGGTTADGPGGLVVVGKDGSHARNLDSAWNLPGGVTSDSSESATFVGGPSAATRDGSRYKTLSKSETGGRIATKTIKTTSKERGGKEIRVRANVRGGQVAGKSGTGQIDKNSVARVFSRRKSAIRYCYEKALKVQPNLKGKVTIRFTIGGAGRITTINATSNTTGNPGVAQCIVNKVRGWRFQPPKGGSVTFSYPFLLDTR